MARAIHSAQHVSHVFLHHVGETSGSWDVGHGEIWYEITLSDWSPFPRLGVASSPWLCWLCVHGSLAMEGSFAFLWTRLRFPIVVAMMCLHAVIAVLFLQRTLVASISRPSWGCVPFLQAREATWREREVLRALGGRKAPTSALTTATYEKFHRRRQESLAGGGVAGAGAVCGRRGR